MPIYEFFCSENNTTYSFLAKSMAYGDKVPRCPANPAFKLQKKVSNFAFIGKAKEEDDDLDGMDDAKMEQVMAELERDMSGMDEENPDPRQMARLMKKMTEMTGGKLSGQMAELVGRLEAGEDPEALDAEFGDAMDDMDLEDGAAAKIGQLRRRLLGSRRDPNLYDMAEYCD
ncbi:cytochrome C [Pelagicoccus albus]|uniref:Cytochrome C n=1 Tax=Pelagicoccus albus TaxID=415222 RepID=A0A7X1B5M1_9BACT|nr:cytochrome C [Pelagicoccus albus]MBC2606071.1 cytochrome C [Pelagicoccus albus]